MTAVLLITPGMAMGLFGLLVTMTWWQQGTCLATSICSVQVQPRVSQCLIPWHSLPKKCHQLLNGLPSESLSCNQLWKNTGCDSDLGLLIFGFKPYQALFYCSCFSDAGVEPPVRRPHPPSARVLNQFTIPLAPQSAQELLHHASQGIPSLNQKRLIWLGSPCERCKVKQAVNVWCGPWLEEGAGFDAWEAAPASGSSLVLCNNHQLYNSKY